MAQAKGLRLGLVGLLGCGLLACGPTNTLATGGSITLDMVDAGSFGAERLQLSATGRNVTGNVLARTASAQNSRIAIHGQTENYGDQNDTTLQQAVSVDLYDIPTAGQRLTLTPIIPDNAMEASVDYEERLNGRTFQWTSDMGTLVIDEVSGGKLVFHTEGGHLQPRGNGAGLATFTLSVTVDEVNGL
jgi:hypothetical protein